MQARESVINCYNKTAAAYAAAYGNELAGKRLDSILLHAFALENRNMGALIDLGCGPGQTTRFLYDEGLTDITGTDISPEMVRVAQQLHPAIRFETADMLSLHYADNSFGSAVAFYAIVHFTPEQVKMALTEVCRILKPGGRFLFSFHTGNEVVHRTEFLGETVDIRFHFFETADILSLVPGTGFTVIDCIERRPYPDIEYPSTRAYITLQKAS